MNFITFYLTLINALSVLSVPIHFTNVASNDNINDDIDTDINILYTIIMYIPIIIIILVFFIF